MQYYTDFDSYRGNTKSVITLGKFECLHLGHQKLIQTVQKYAGEQGLISIVAAFDMGGRAVLTDEERRESLEDRIDCLIQCPFTENIRQMEAGDFIENVLVKTLSASYIVTGADFRFGYMAKGDVSMLKKYQSLYDYKLITVEKEKYKGRKISSTYVREALKGGDVELAGKLMGYPYRITGTVGHGRGLGRTLGYPTINIEPSQKKVIPKFGVYACRVMIDGVWYFGAGNVGLRPTVSDGDDLCAEVFLFDYSGSAYGRKAVLEFCTFRRPEMKFSSVEELKRQVDSDVEYVRRYFHSP